MLSGIGVMSMIALRDPIRDTLTAAGFVSGVGGGLALLVAASEIDFEASPLRRAVLAPLSLALGIAALLLLLGSGPGTSGVKVNLFGVQPVEAIRLLVVFALAAYFAGRLDLLRELSEPATPERPWLRYVRVPRWKDVRPVVVSMTLVLAFFFLQKDLGPALVLSCVVMALYAIARGRTAFVFTGFAMLLAGFAAAYWIGHPATVGQRVAIWLDPWNNGVPGGNQIAHGLWALSTGSRLGRRAGHGECGIGPGRAHRFRARRDRRGTGLCRYRGCGRAVCASELALPARGRPRARRLHGVPRDRRGARAGRAGVRDCRGPARARAARGGGYAVRQLRPLVDAGQLPGGRDRAGHCAAAWAGPDSVGGADRRTRHRCSPG